MTKKSADIARIEKKLEQVLLNQEKMMRAQKTMIADDEKLIDGENKELRKESEILRTEQEEFEELQKIERLEKDLEKQLKTPPLRHITYRDITKGMIGAFFGVVGHFAFAKGVEVASHIDFIRATVLLVVSMMILIAFLYFTGFRKINDTVKYKFIPLRAIVIYCTALITSTLVLALYGEITTHTSFIDLYKTIASMSMLAVIGAATADLIGRNEND